MKKQLILASAVLGLALSANAQVTIPVGQQALLAGWDFNNLSATAQPQPAPRYSDVWGDQTAQTGSPNAGRIHFNGLFGSDNWPSASRVAAGADIDRPIIGRGPLSGLGSLSGGEGMLSTGVGSAINGARNEFAILVHSLDPVNSFGDIKLSVWGKDGGTGGSTINWSYSIDGGATKTSTGLSSVFSGGVFTESFLDFSAIAALDAKADVSLIGTVVPGGADSIFQFDNVAVYGTALPGVVIPEPSTYGLLLGFVTIGVVVARRRFASSAIA